MLIVCVDIFVDEVGMIMEPGTVCAVHEITSLLIVNTAAHIFRIVFAYHYN